jgi:hypothetical protein
MVTLIDGEQLGVLVIENSLYLIYIYIYINFLSIQVCSLLCIMQVKWILLEIYSLIFFSTILENPKEKSNPRKCHRPLILHPLFLLLAR